MEEQTPQEVELDYNLEHRAFLEENEIDLKKVPKSIRSKMRSMNMLIGKYKKTPTEANKQVIIKNDIMICDMLQDWQEQDYPDNYIEGKQQDPPTNEETPPANEETPPANSEAELEKKIKDNLMQGTNRIKVGVLKSIIGKTPDYPKQKVGSLVLKKVFLNDCYEIV